MRITILKLCIVSFALMGAGWIHMMGTVTLAAQEDTPFVLIPEKQNEYTEKVKKLGGKDLSKKFWEQYNKDAEALKDDVGGQMGSGIMNWDTILSLLQRVIVFITNSALVVGAAMVIYAGYLYAVSVFAGDYTSQAKEAIKRGIIGIVVVIFSYAILRWVLHAFL